MGAVGQGQHFLRLKKVYRGKKDIGAMAPISR